MRRRDRPGRSDADVDDQDVHVEVGKGESPETAIAVLKEKVRLISRIMVTKDEFTPVKLLTYGFAAIIISTVLATVLSYVLRSSAAH